MKVREFSYYAEERKSCSFINKLFLPEPMTKARCAATCEWCLRDPLRGCGTAVGRLVCMERVRVSVGKLHGMRAGQPVSAVCRSGVKSTGCVQIWLWKVPRCKSGRGQACGATHMRVMSVGIPFISTPFQGFFFWILLSPIPIKAWVRCPFEGGLDQSRASWYPAITARSYKA